MSGYVALSCMCQNCNEFFLVKKRMTNVVNLDYDECGDLFDHKLNKVECKNCMSKFTFELPMIIFSAKNKFAIKVSPNMNPQYTAELSTAPHYLVCRDFRFREVTYQIEAVEKAKIFLDGFDDRYIEYVKLKSFDDTDATPFDTNNIVYERYNNGNLYFRKYDSDNNVIGDYVRAVHAFDNHDEFYKEVATDNKWEIINRYTLKKHITNGG